MKTRRVMAVLLALFFFVCLTRRTEIALSLDNRIYAMAMNASYSGAWIYFWEIVSSWGEGKVVYPLTGVIAVMWVSRRRNWRTLALLAVMTAGFLTNTALKFFFQMERPVSLSPYTELTTYSFPSGHAFNAVVLFWFLPRFFGIALGKPAERGILSPWFWGSGMALVGLSRVFLGAHWATDVAGGWILGGAVSSMLVVLLEKSVKDVPA